MADTEPPDGIIEAGVSRLWMDGEILVGEPIPGGASTTESVKDVMAAIESLAGGTRPRLLYDMRELRFVHADARRLAVRQFHQVVSAAAVVVDGGVSELLMDFFRGLDEGEIPLRVFTDSAEARAWLESLDGEGRR